MISRPTLSCSHWREFVYTECHHDVIMTLRHSNGPVCCEFSRRRIFYLIIWTEQVLLAAIFLHLELWITPQLSVRHHVGLHPVVRPELLGRVRVLRCLCPEETTHSAFIGINCHFDWKNSSMNNWIAKFTFISSSARSITFVLRWTVKSLSLIHSRLPDRFWTMFGVNWIIGIVKILR